jgi:SAM-dependent methyltransferase
MRAPQRDWIISQGCYAESENARIYDKWFAQDRRSFMAVYRAFSFDTRVVCDIGCAYGGSIARCGDGSWGIELEPYMADFARSVGLDVYHADFLDDDIAFPSADAIWSADVLEHVDSPHVFIRRAHQVLNEAGVLCLKVPVIPPAQLPLPVVRRYQAGYRQADHINAFTARTLRFICERAGFRTLVCGLFVRRELRWLNLPTVTDLTGQCLYVGEKISDWMYPEGSTRKATSEGKGYRFQGQDFGT